MKNQEWSGAAASNVDRPCSDGTVDDQHSELPRLMRKASGNGLRERSRPGDVFVARLGGEVDGRSWHVLDAQGNPLVARKAQSCMLVPSCGDLVQILVEGISAWVLAVLERDPAIVRAAIDLGDADVEVHAGSLVFNANRGISHRAEELCSISRAVREITDEKSSLVRQSSIVRAGAIAVNVERHLGFRSKLATISADALLKLDGAQIHMG